MYRTLKLKLLLDEGQKLSLLRTMEAYTQAFDISARWGYENKVKNRLTLQRGSYYVVREQVKGLSSRLVQSASDLAYEALKRCKNRTIPKRRKLSAVRYRWREAIVWLESGKVNIWSIDGRIHTTFAQAPFFRKYYDWKCIMSVLIFNKKENEFYLGQVVEKETPPPRKEVSVLGIDRGLKNVAVCSNNSFFNSARINSVRGRYAKNKAELQAKGTRSAKRKLREQSGRERQFMTCENHRISKILVNTLFSVFALEDLKGIQENRCLGPNLRSRLRRWSYYQLEQDLKYKAEELGKSIVFIDPTCTSQWCSKCGWIEKKSRNGSDFHCVKCGFHLHADLNASRIIAHLGISEAGRLFANQPNATDNEEGVSGAQGKDPSPVASCASKPAVSTPWGYQQSALGASNSVSSSKTEISFWKRKGN